VPAEREREIEARALEDWAERFQVPLSIEGREALLEYGRLLLAWGERINLTAAKSLSALVAEHLPDAFAIAGRLGSGGRGKERVIDVGSGGGLPALPLALLRRESTFTLVEVTAKKVAFLRTAVRELGLGGRVTVEQRRIGPPAGESGAFEVATSRAMLAPSEWLALGQRLVAPGGRVFCLGSRALTQWPPGLELVTQDGYRPDRWVSELKRST
jgi:16S rRNA (guanine527-N7)-methyltransferase